MGLVYNLIQQPMRTRKASQSHIMQEAIQKASQLIALLQKENNDLKRKVQNLEGQLENRIKKNSQGKTMREKLQQQTKRFEDKVEQIHKQLQDERQKRAYCEESLKRKTIANKELHEKLSVMSAKIKQKTKQCNDQKTKILSVENQNEYLLKKLRQYEDKENIEVKKVSLVQRDLQRQLREMQKLKDAFARRCEELKIDNATLTEAAASYKQKYIDGDQLKKTMKINPRQFRQEVSPKVVANNSGRPTNLQILIRQALGVTPNASKEGQIDQIASFIQYRLSHIQNMWQSIMEKLSIKQWKKIQNLKDINFVCQRISSYLTELLASSN